MITVIPYACRLCYYPHGPNWSSMLIKVNCLRHLVERINKTLNHGSKEELWVSVAVGKDLVGRLVKIKKKGVSVKGKSKKGIGRGKG